VLDARNHLAREIDDVVHERAARKFPVLHLFELEFPVPCELRRAQFVHPEVAQREEERRSLRRRLELATDAVHIVLVNQTLDDLRTGCRSTQSLLAHGFAQLLVLDQFSGAFHRREQRGFREAGRRLCLDGANIHLARAHFFFVLDCNEARRFARFSFLAVDLEPAGFSHDSALGLERFALDAGDPRRHEILRCREEHGEKALHDQIVKFPFRLGEMPRPLHRGDDREVVGNLLVVEYAFVRFDPAFLEYLGRVARVARFLRNERVEGFLHGAEIILG